MAWLFVLAALMLLDSGTVLNAVNGAAGVFVRSVMPALFPMMVLNGLSARLSGRERRWMTVGFCWLGGVGPAAGRALGAGRAYRAGAAAHGGGDGGHEPFVFGRLAGRPPAKPGRRLADADRPLAGGAGCGRADSSVF